MTRAVADTSFVVAMRNKSDRHHRRCMTIYEQQTTVYLPQSTLAEICYFLTKAKGNVEVAHFLWDLPASKLQMIALEEDDLLRTADILDKYHDTRLDFVDATIAAVAERLKITRILTLDYRDFGLLRPRHAEHFELLPQIE